MSGVAPASGFVAPRGPFRPAYLATWESGDLESRARAALDGLRTCRVCPRDCDVDRLAEEQGICRVGRFALVASAFPHFGEEDCLSGRQGSGTIFLAGCNLRCVFCQNWDLSWEAAGEPFSPLRLAELMMDLQRRGCHNLNFVTPEHVVPQILEALTEAVPRGFGLPIVYNTSAYDSVESLRLLDGVVDIYMPDFKLWDPGLALRFLGAADYPKRARVAIREMHRQVGDLVLDEEGLALRGVLVRHLVMPDATADTRRIMSFLGREISADTWVNIMAQYRPAGKVLERPERYGSIARGVHGREMRLAYAAAREAGLHRFDRWESDLGL